MHVAGLDKFLFSKANYHSKCVEGEVIVLFKQHATNQSRINALVIKINERAVQILSVQQRKKNNKIKILKIM